MKISDYKKRLDSLTEDEFNQLPLVIEGESKIVRYIGDGLVAIKFKPTIHSFTYGRSDIVPGSELYRLQASKILAEVINSNPIIQASGIRHAYKYANDKFVLADLMLQPPSINHPNPFRPADICWQKLWDKKQISPPLEVVVKTHHGGTTEKKLYGMDKVPILNHPTMEGKFISGGSAYPYLIVRIDWRNPNMVDGKSKADEEIPDSIAQSWINVSEAKTTALKTFDALQDFLALKDIVIYDICLFIDVSGKVVFSELGPDGGRFRHFTYTQGKENVENLDKDVFRARGSNKEVLEKWKKLVEVIK